MSSAKSLYRRFPAIDDYRAAAPKEGRKVGGRRNVAMPHGVSRGLVSVVTVCFNSEQSIERTIRSVTQQNYPNVEYIVIDGGSSDGTLEILRSWSDHIDTWVSEKDLGISDAFNKGISLAGGEFAMLVNSDDWLEPDHLRIAVDGLRACKADYVFGNLIIHDPSGRVLGELVGDPGYADRIAHKMPFINHPSVVCRREAFIKYGLFNTSLHHAMDYEWFLRAFTCGCRGRYLSQLASHVTLEGRSDRWFTRSLAEVRDISIAYGNPAAIAWMRFIGRLLKGHARRKLEWLLPAFIYTFLRSGINRNFRGKRI
jgi:glycosyltransferase involved in cell wall biosynthesis